MQQVQRQGWIGLSRMVRNGTSGSGVRYQIVAGPLKWWRMVYLVGRVRTQKGGRARKSQHCQKNARVPGEADGSRWWWGGCQVLRAAREREGGDANAEGEAAAWAESGGGIT